MKNNQRNKILEKQTGFVLLTMLALTSVVLCSSTPGWKKEGYESPNGAKNKIMIAGWQEIIAEQKILGNTGSQISLNGWNDKLGKTDIGNRLLEDYEKKLKKDACPFIRTVLKSPQGKPPPPVCVSRFITTLELFDSVGLTYAHVPGHRAFVEFEEANTQIGLAANVVCAFTKTVSNVPPAAVGITWDWSAITIELKCAAEAIKGLICRKLGNDLVSMFRSIQKQVYEGNNAFSGLSGRSDYGDSLEFGDGVEHRQGNMGITVIGDPTGFAITKFIMDTRSKLAQSPIQSIFQLNLPDFKDIRLTAQRTFCKHYSIGIKRDLTEIFQDEPEKLAQLTNFKPTCEAMCIYNDHPEVAFEMTKKDYPVDSSREKNMMPLLKLNSQLTSPIACESDREFDSSYCLIDVDRDNRGQTKNYSVQNIGITIGQSVLHYLTNLQTMVKGFHV